MTLPPSARHPRPSAAMSHSAGSRTPVAQLAAAHQIRHTAPPCSATKRTPPAPTSTIHHTHAIPAPAPRLILALKSQVPQGCAR
jgi:hypothetical protein